MAEADRRGDEQRAPRTRQAGHPPAGAGRAGGHAIDQIAQQEVERDGVAPLRPVAGALEQDELPAGQLCERHATVVADDVVVRPVHDEHRAAHLPAGRLDLGLVRQARGEGLACDQHLRGRVVREGDEVLDLLRRVRLREDLTDEEVDEAVVVAQPVVLVVLRPALVGGELLVPGVRGARGIRRDDERDCAADEHRPENALRMPRREVQRVECAERDAHDDRGVDTSRVENGGSVIGELDRVVRLRTERPVGEAVPTAVEGHDPVVAGQVRDLALPHPGVDDPPRREQEHGRLAGAEAFPGDPDAVALDNARRVRLLRPCAGVRRHGLASNTRLNGVSAARRKRLNPPAETTSRIRASPAWAPSASPTSCESEAGVQRNVEKP